MLNGFICAMKGHKYTNHIVNLCNSRALYQCERCKRVDVSINESKIGKDFLVKEHKIKYRI